MSNGLVSPAAVTVSLLEVHWCGLVSGHQANVKGHCLRPLYTRPTGYPVVTFRSRATGKPESQSERRHTTFALHCSEQCNYQLIYTIVKSQQLILTTTPLSSKIDDVRIGIVSEEEKIILQMLQNSTRDNTLFAISKTVSL